MVRALGIVLLLAVGGGLCGGCSRKNEAPVPSDRFLFESGGRASPGVGLKSYYYFWAPLKFDGQPVALVVTNTPGMNGGGQRAIFHEHDGRRVEVTTRGGDLGSAKVVIEGREFALSDGALFLVTLPDQPARVQQLAVDIGPLLADPPKGLKAIGEKHPEIQGFLEACHR
jgi:hypothetical protein